MSITIAIKSPITGTDNVILERTIDCELIIATYQDQLNINVEKYFTNLQHIEIYRCLDTGYRFYYPFNLEGDSNFYEALQDIPWYYVDWKWEFNLASKLISNSDRVLEVGSGRGAFLRHLKERGITATGLELNEQAIQSAQNIGLDMRNQTIQECSVLQSGHYDVVCSFQVAEHISHVRSFIQASVDALRVGGKLIICVPNNDSFVRHESVWITNMPPHHMGLWGKAALQNLENVFPLNLEKIYTEPLTTYAWYYYLQTQQLLAKLPNHRVVQRVARIGVSVLRSPSLKILPLCAPFIPGHSILAVYKKISRDAQLSTAEECMAL
ncbi:MAG: class I SAM-dependent methyltransferase [Leptolyngbya sp. UWPOB_LEPTO1]|uniref:class I SAM-dependent methyltransferase n=1 Tax=Leptolyngbya sp. UWPOB_LEPTO1 TaxID=2815653 RepID=UPI001AD26221|nr:class I SAM-dependent methyltransferase [Leptolyngbya sp. UWPOB_LEPTO1]MBN8559306.1 class I SAM-dependent methyltransferase [Leptolyngbya sp. UWPOB_LEPTO1]